MKKISVFAITLVVLSLIWISCGNENIELQNDDLKKIKIKVKNPNNPYDEKGQEHNEMLEAFVNEVIIAENMIIDENGEVDILGTVFEYFEVDQKGQDAVENFYGTGHQDVSEYDQDMLKLYNKKKAEFDTYFEIKSIVENESLDLQQKINSIVKIESKIANSNLSKSSKEIMLISTSIGRHSLLFWAPKAQGGMGYYDILDINLPYAIDWWGVGRTDIYGAATAAFGTGNPLIALGWGAVASALDALDGALTS